MPPDTRTRRPDPFRNAVDAVGDVFMFAGGIPGEPPAKAASSSSSSSPDDGLPPASCAALRVARLGLDMVRAASSFKARYGVALRLRIGISTGPATGVVCGCRPPRYSLLGDTVAAAGAAAAAAAPMAVLVTSSTAEAMLLRGPKGLGMVLEPRGWLDVPVTGAAAAALGASASSRGAQRAASSTSGAVAAGSGSVSVGGARTQLFLLRAEGGADGSVYGGRRTVSQPSQQLPPAGGSAGDGQDPSGSSRRGRRAGPGSAAIGAPVPALKTDSPLPLDAGRDSSAYASSTLGADLPPQLQPQLQPQISDAQRRVAAAAMAAAGLQRGQSGGSIGGSSSAGALPRQQQAPPTPAPAAAPHPLLRLIITDGPVSAGRLPPAVPPPAQPQPAALQPTQPPAGAAPGAAAASADGCTPASTVGGAAAGSPALALAAAGSAATALTAATATTVTSATKLPSSGSGSDVGAGQQQKLLLATGSAPPLASISASNIPGPPPPPPLAAQQVTVLLGAGTAASASPFAAAAAGPPFGAGPGSGASARGGAADASHSTAGREWSRGAVHAPSRDLPEGEVAAAGGRDSREGSGVVSRLGSGASTPEMYATLRDARRSVGDDAFCDDEAGNY